MKHKQYTPWLTENIKLMIKMRDKAHRKYVKGKTPQNLDYYRQLKNYTNGAIKREKEAYFNSISNSGNKVFWKNIKNST